MTSAGDVSHRIERRELRRRRIVARKRRERSKPAATWRQKFAECYPLDGHTLIDPGRGLGIIWSAKSACSKVVLWYYRMTGVWDAAMSHSRNPHRYRVEVLYESNEYMRWMRETDWRSLAWYQFFRDPVRRALSSYRHNLSHGHADDRISAALRRNVSCLTGYSLDDFLLYLEAIDLSRKCDPHVKLQTHPISEFVPVKLIKIDETDMLAQMNAIERAHGLPLTDFVSATEFFKDERRRANITARPDYASSDVLTRQDARGDWPVDTSVLSPETTRRIERLYQTDIEFAGAAAGRPAAAEDREPAPRLYGS